MRSVLITGATGYFGQGMVKHLLTQPNVERICIYSRDEAKQAAMRQAIADPHDRLRFFIGDVRDKDRMTRAMAGIELVIHSAALKRVEVGENDTAEMIKTNVMGTMNMIEAATAAGVKKVVALSTDKACQPRNAYGASKLLLEKLVLGANNARGANGPRLSCTRYGNVANSTGSVIPTWRAIFDSPDRTKQFNVTSIDATRFWMTLQEAIDLVLDTAKTMHGGELVIPDLPAYRLYDLIDAMGLFDTGHTPNITGLTIGEKLHERLKEDGPDSSQVRRLTVDELKERLASI
ncbi:WcaG Nucleoside-diphosphate-sugar epimerases [uncultured Caudovirales phage]|uniref:WcaG Nucleoside-diphosphate-sugar epimerases n=1 Tax=uncultured Caudovirales phage TaxID=2100421 RepID=A0A6J5T9E7_9CAUD|nr:WcaG Nucleoside-diphosphate-sugar epimerases [uncultured Caudovirales phage]